MIFLLSLGGLRDVSLQKPRSREHTKLTGVCNLVAYPFNLFSQGRFAAY
jgi:hypothetical protein